MFAGMMTPRVTLLFLALGLVLNTSGMLRAETGGDSAEGLEGEYAKHYLISKSTMSVNEKVAVIYPRDEFSKSKEARNFLVALKPFKVLGVLPASKLLSENSNHTLVAADWTNNDSLALITSYLEWGPVDVFLMELTDDGLKRITNMMVKMRELVRPKFRAAKPKPAPYSAAEEFALRWKKVARASSMAMETDS